MTMPDHFRQALIDADVNLVRKLWGHVFPHLPAFGNDAEVLTTIHMSRTVMENLPLRVRAYSHRWLLDNGHPSALPDHLRSRAERIYPKIVEAVGISVGASSEPLKSVLGEVRGAMENAVLECYADRRTEPHFVKERIQEARKTTIRKLLGR